MPPSDARARFVRSRVGPIGLALVLLVTAVSVVGPLASPHDPNLQLRDTLVRDDGLPVGPGVRDGHILGGDPLGRDELSRLLHGGRVSMVVAYGSTLLSVVLGVVIGVVAGFLGGALDTALVFFIDVMLSMPFLLVAMCLRKVLPGSSGLGTLILLLGGLSWPGIARIVRARTLTLRELDYVAAARAMGASNARIVLTHLVPNLAGPIIALSTGMVAGMVLSESSLSFLGLGVAPPAASWGAMLSESEGYLFDVPRLFAYPAALLVTTVLGFNLLGQGLRDALDPKD